MSFFATHTHTITTCFDVGLVPRLYHLYLEPSHQIQILECGPMPNVMAALPNIGGSLCSTPQRLADAHY